jgi:hypothetical protein
MHCGVSKLGTAYWGGLVALASHLHVLRMSRILRAIVVVSACAAAARRGSRAATRCMSKAPSIVTPHSSSSSSSSARLVVHSAVSRAHVHPVICPLITLNLRAAPLLPQIVPAAVIMLILIIFKSNRQFLPGSSAATTSLP